MDEKPRETDRRGRRAFLVQASAAAAASVTLAGSSQAEPAADANAGPLPTIKLGEHTVTRFIAGWNPIGGHAHAVQNLAKHMLEHFTEERINQFVQDCEDAGINCWQLSHGEKAIAACRHLRERGSKLKLLCLHAEGGLDEPVPKVIQDTGSIALIHHGGVTDALFRAGKYQQVHDYVKKVHDAGALAGVSAHSPDNIKRVADEGWENDFFMTCFYYVTRPREKQQEELGKVVVGEPFFESDPDDMTAVARQIEKPCLGFKILAAGRKCSSSYSVKKAFKYAFENLKPIDGVIVGMYPRFHDEIADNVQYTREFGVV
jgi:hypothetical protein